MKKRIRMMMKNRIIRRMPVETEQDKMSWPVEVFYGSDYYCSADEVTE